MAGISDLLTRFQGAMDAHPGDEELLAALPLIAGAYASASHKRGIQGIGNALEVAGGLGEYDAQTRVGKKADADQLAKQNKAWQSFAGGIKPGESPTDVIKGAAAAGVPVPEAISTWKELQTPSKSANLKTV